MCFKLEYFVSKDSVFKMAKRTDKKATKNNNKEAEKLPKKSIADLFKQLALATAPDNEEDIEEPKPKPMNAYKFWKTQPVTKFDEAVFEEGPIAVSYTHLRATRH